MDFVNLDETLKCSEHESPFIICNIVILRKGKDKLDCEFTVACPVDQKIEKKTVELLLADLKKLNLGLADKIFRCEKCFREAKIEEAIKEKKAVSVYLFCPQHGKLIIREISPDLYDGIRFAWDMKDVKKEEAKTY
jgi:hypothetical protein